MKVPNIVRDQRFKALMNLMDRVKKEDPPGFYLYPNGNIYCLAHVLMESSIKKAREYFWKEAFFDTVLRYKGVVSPILNDEISGLVLDGTTVTIHYTKDFSDGLIQLAGFGAEREEQRTCWAFYGHVVSRQNK